MNGCNNIIKQLGFDGNLLSMKEVSIYYPAYRDLERLGIDEFYFLAGHPAALFCNTDRFDDDYSIRVAQILHKAWNYQKVLLLISYSDFEIRVYNCYTKPNYVSNDSEYEQALKSALISESSLQDNNLDTFISFFSREALDTGALWHAHNNSLKIDVSRRVDAYLVESLDKTKKQLMQDGLSERYVHALLIRSLFVLFLEDNGATAKAGIYSSIMPDSTSYFDILQSKDATYKLFDVLNKQFSGDITHLSNGERNSVKQKHLDIIRKCFLDGELSDNPKLYGDWRLFQFDIIRIELLSEIYEHFLGASKSAKGQYYTPSNLVNLILDDKISLDTKRWDLKILDPACGSGIFLVESYKRLIGIWKKENGVSNIDFLTLKTILCNCIYGIDIDETALSVTAFSLYLTLINELDPRTLWADPSYKLPCLIHGEKDDRNIEGKLWCADAIETDFTERIHNVDLVVGNPPYGTNHNQQSIRDYCKKLGFANEMSIPFIHKSALFCPNGEIVLIVNMKILTNTNGPYARFRDWLLKMSYVEKIYNFSVFRNAPINYGGSLFSSAKTPVAVLFYKATRPELISKSLSYWSPRTYVKSNMLYDIVLDSCDIKYLPREICEQNDASIWKIGAWGNTMAYRFVKRIKERPSLKKTFIEQRWLVGRGCNADSSHPDFIPESIIKLDIISRYRIDADAADINNQRKYYRNNKSGLFDAPYVVMKECPDKNGVIAGLFNGNAISTTSTFVFNGMSDDDKIVLVAYLNSKIANTLLFLTSSTWGIERDRLLLDDEVMMLPSPFVNITYEQKKAIISVYQDICRQMDEYFDVGIDNLERELDKIFYSVFDLSELEIEVVEDIYYNSLKLFSLKDKSEAMKKNSREWLTLYAKKLCETLNDYYSFSNTSVSPEVLVPHVQDSLSMVAVRFGDKKKEPLILDNQQDRYYLKKLYGWLASKPSNGIVIQRVLRDYQSDNVVLIKPNQRRYWTAMQALEDGASVFSEILALNNSHNE